MNIINCPSGMNVLQGRQKVKELASKALSMPQVLSKQAKPTVKLSGSFLQLSDVGQHLCGSVSLIIQFVSFLSVFHRLILYHSSLIHLFCPIASCCILFLWSNGAPLRPFPPGLQSVVSQLAVGF